VELEGVLVAEGSATTDFTDFEARLKQIYQEYTFEFAAEESGVDARVIEEIAKIVSSAGTQFSES
jgi:hypothetical protein